MIAISLSDINLNSLIFIYNTSFTGNILVSSFYNNFLIYHVIQLLEGKLAYLLSIGIYFYESRFMDLSGHSTQLGSSISSEKSPVSYIFFFNL